MKLTLGQKWRGHHLGGVNFVWHDYDVICELCNKEREASRKRESDLMCTGINEENGVISFTAVPYVTKG